MALFNYSKFKVRIDPQSKKTQGLQAGDIVRRQYKDGNNIIYSLMVVLEAGIDILYDKDNKEQKSPYFIGALIEGDEPKSGELLDFVRVTNLFNSDRSGAMYLTASDNDSPYMDVIDGMAYDNSLCYPFMGAGEPDIPSINKYACTGSSYLSSEYFKSNKDSYRVFRITRNETPNAENKTIGFKQTLEKELQNPQMVVVSYKVRASKPINGVDVSLGYVDGTEIDGKDTINISADWEYRLSLITVEFPKQYTRSLLIDLTSHLSKGDWCEISDLNIILLSDIANFPKSTKSRIGKIKGIIDPIFGSIEGYGAYFQKLYATKDVNISGTLTAGDENGFASTFYVGRIHKNCLINSLYGNFSTPVETSIEEISPTGIGNVFTLPIGKTILVCQKNDWITKHNRQKYCFSFWAKSSDVTNITISQNGNEKLQDVAIDTVNEWVRYNIPFITKSNKGADLTIEITSVAQILFTSPQLEAGDKASLYQATDSHLDETDAYGAWFSRGGIGGTIQNPLLRLNPDGSISSNNGSFVINRDGSGYFAGGAITWNEKEVLLQENVILKWDNLDKQTQENLKGESAYSVNGSLTNYTFQANSLGVITSNQSATTKIYAYKGNENVDFSIGEIPSVPGLSITKNDSLKTITFSVAEGTESLADNGNIEIPVSIDSASFRVPFAWSKAKAGASGDDTESLDWIKDWNNGKTQIGANSVITPKIFTGVKNKNGTITGTAIGRFDLNSINASGEVVVEAIDGIYGFRDGLRTFSIDNTGSIQLGRDNQFIKYNAKTGKVEFGSEVTLNWTEAINTAKTETLNSAAITAQSKADAAKNEAINTSAKDASNKIDAVKFGARNYIRNSNFSAPLSGVTADGTEISIDNDTLYNNYKTLKVIQDTACTNDNANSLRTYFTPINAKICFPGSFSMYVKGSVEGDMKIRIGTTNIQTKAITTEWQRITVENIPSTSAVVVFGFATVGTYWCALPMLVEGTKSVDWSPAPEDISNGISDAQKAGTNAKAVADAITNKANNEGWSTKLTYVTSTGIFTGTLSANTVNTIQLNASQITAGTINAARIDVAALKSSLITAGNIEALTLNVVRGKIGGWSIDADSIYQGVKNNTSGAYTAASGAVCIGSNGIRGFKWRLDSTGAGALAGGNIAWDANGNVTFGSNVTLNWTNAANSAATNALNSAKSYADTKKTEAISSASTDATNKANAAKELASAMAFGKMLYRDPTFWNGNNGIAAYNNNSNGTVTVTRTADSNAPNDSKYVLLIKNTGTSSPNCGGFHFNTNTSYRKIFITRIIAKIPSGRNISYHSNAIGNGGSQKWLTPIAGTGDWCEYICKVSCGTSNFSSTNFFAIDGSVGTTSAPVEWRVAYATVFDVTSTEKYTTSIDGNGIYTSTLNANQITAGTISADRIAANSLNGNKITARTISADRIIAGAVTANEIAANTITAAKIASRTITADRIATGTITASEINVGSIRTSVLTADAVNALTCNFVRGKIGGFSIGSDTMTVGNIGAAGATPIQIRSTSIGSGYWYTGAYKPLGITLTWHQNANAGHIVFGQVAATGSTIRSGFIGLQMMAWDNTEYFCLSTNHTKSGGKEVYNRIAGWAFDNNHIWKNNVSLGSDGTIYNGEKWRLNNDGSGKIANGNISWNAAGAVTFSSAVTLNWTNAANNALNSAKSYADTKKNEAINSAATTAQQKADAAKNAAISSASTDATNKVNAIQVGGTNLVRNSSLIQNQNSWSGGTRVTDMALDGRHSFRNIESGLTANAWRGFIQRYGVDVKVGDKFTASIYTRSDNINSLDAGAAMEIRYYNSSNARITQSTVSIKPTANNTWQRFTVSGTCPSGTVVVEFVAYVTKNGRLWYNGMKLERGNKMTDWSPAPGDVEARITRIDANGIYTGTISASQINAGTISADRIATNSLHGNRITARTISADRIVTGAITANEIAGNTITASKIASRTITADRIATGVITANEIAGGTITAAKIASRTITADRIASGAITANEINVGSIRASVLTADAVNGLTCTFVRGRIGGFIINDHAIYSQNVTAGHTIGIQNNGYMYNANSSNNVDYWALNTDGSALFGTNKIRFNADGSGWLANKKITWDAAGNTTFNGYISGGQFTSLNARTGKGSIGLNGSGISISGDQFWVYGDMYSQGQTAGRSNRYYASNIWCRGSLGYTQLNTVEICGSYAYYYPDGYGSGKTKVYVTLKSATSSQGGTYYTIPLYAPEGYSALAGFPVNFVKFTWSATNTTYKYVLSGFPGQSVIAFNANDNSMDNTRIIFLSGRAAYLAGGELAHFINVGNFNLYPAIPSANLGAGWMILGSRDNNWR